MLALWVRALPVVEALDETLVLVGYGLITLAWARFVIGLWRVIGGSGQDPVERDDRTGVELAPD